MLHFFDLRRPLSVSFSSYCIFMAAAFFLAPGLG